MFCILSFLYLAREFFLIYVENKLYKLSVMLDFCVFNRKDEHTHTERFFDGLYGIRLCYKCKLQIWLKVFLEHWTP